MIGNKVLVRAGKFKGGKLPYVNYVGQIKPADMPQIVWYGAFGNDGTGDGSISAPFLTFDAALDAFSTTTHKWILKTDLTVYGDADAAPYIDDPADRVYLDPTKADDSGDGLTAATAKKTYAAAKTVLGSSARSAIHCIGSFTLTDVIDARIQGEAGSVLTYDASPSAPTPAVIYAAGGDNTNAGGIADNGAGVLIVAARSSITSNSIIMRSTDNGATWSAIANPWTATADSAFRVSYGNSVFIVGGLGAGKILRSTDQGLTWSEVTIASSRTTKKLIFTGSLHVAFMQKVSAPVAPEIYTSPDGATWTQRTSAWADPLTSVFVDCASDGAGVVMAVGASGAAGRAQISSDHGATWSDISATINPGGVLDTVAFGNGTWTVFSNAAGVPKCFQSVSPSAAWTERTGIFEFPANQVQIARYSDSLGGVVFTQSDGNPGGLRARLLTPTASTFLFSFLTQLPMDIRFVTDSGVEYGFIVGNPYLGLLQRQIERFVATYGNIKADCANIELDVSKSAVAIRNTKIANMTIQPTTGVGITSADGCSLLRNKVVSADSAAIVHAGAVLTMSRNVVKGSTPAFIAGAAENIGDISIKQNIFAGGLSMLNTGGTDKEVIQDNIIEGGFSASELVTVKSNIRGVVVNSTSQSVISTIPPIFVDTTDYFLSRIALGQTVDSPLISRSAFSSFVYNSETFKDDFGPYRAFTALVQTVYKRAFALPRFSGNALSEDVENVAALLKSIRGKPDVSNRPQGRLEIISWTSKSVNAEVREFVSYMEKQTDLEVYLDYDWSGKVPDSVTINGAHSAGTYEINIQPQDIPVGTIINLFSKNQIVTQRYPRAGDATKLVLDDVLSGGLTNGQGIPIAYIQGAGVFVYVPNRPRKNLRVFSRRRDTYSGMSYTFVRKAE